VCVLGLRLNSRKQYTSTPHASSPCPADPCGDKVLLTCMADQTGWYTYSLCEATSMITGKSSPDSP
jgi:hypothetical protein